MAIRRFSVKLTRKVCEDNGISLSKYRDTFSQPIPDDTPKLEISDSDIEDEFSEEEEEKSGEEDLVDEDKDNPPKE